MEHDSRSGSRDPIHTDHARQTGNGPQQEHRVVERRGAAGMHGDTDVVDASATDSREVGPSSNDVETHFKIQFAAGSAFVRKFEEARALLSSRYPRGASFESVLEAGLDAFLDRNSPTRRNRRRKARKARTAGEERTAREKRIAGEEGTARMGEDRTAGEERTAREAHEAREEWRATGRSTGKPVERAVERFDRSLPQRESKTRSSRKADSQRGGRGAPRRPVPAAVRDAVFERDDGCCTFIGGDGRRCGSKHDLEVDHCQPVARGGTNTLDNLRVLCAVHNRLEAERVFGAAWMSRFAGSA